MANTRELRRRIKSIKNTSQITKAMEMVAATKMRKAQNQAISGRPYNQNLDEALNRLLPKISTEVHPLLQGRSEAGVGVLVLSTDKSLCGSLNTNLLRVAEKFSQEKKNVVFYSVGKKGRNYIAKTGKQLQADFENQELVSFRGASLIAKHMVNSFLTGEIGEAYLIYPHFLSTLRQEPMVLKLLPIDLTLPDGPMARETSETRSEFLLEPNADELLEYVLLHSIETKIYQALLETKASEHSARMIAMQNATDNAQELVGDLQLSYNQIRQDSITNELLEITSANAALGG